MIWNWYIFQIFGFSTLWCSLAKTIIAPHLIFAVTCVVRYGLKFSENHNCTAPHFCDHICDMVYKIRFEWFEIGIYFKFLAFLPNPKLIFSFILVQVLNYWANFSSLFLAGFLNQHLLRLSNFFFFWLKTRVIKLLIIYLILKIIKYINI